MKNVVVTLLSKKPSELSRFLNSYYGAKIINEEGSFKWTIFYNSPAECIGILSTMIDNIDTYQIEVLLTLNKVTTIKITDENINDLIKIFIFTNYNH